MVASVHKLLRRGRRRLVWGVVFIFSSIFFIWLFSPKNISGEHAITNPQLDGSPRIPAIDLRTEDAAVITINGDPEQRL